LALDSLRQICRPAGLAEAHFDWSGRSVRLLRNQLGWLMRIALPAVLVVSTLRALSHDGLSTSLGRFTFVAGMLACSVVLYRTLRPVGGVLQEALARNRQGAMYRLRYLWYPTSVTLPVVLAVMAAEGYYYTSLQLTWRLFAMVCVGLGLLVLYSLLVRKLVIVKRRLAREQAQQRRAALQANAGNDAAGVDEAGTPVEIPQTDLTAVSSQTRHILRSFILLAGGVAAWAIWIDVLPALRFLDDFSIWPTETGEAVTLQNVLLALGIAAVAAIATRDIPGLLEMTVLPRLPLDAGGRYAVSSVSRYLLILLGVVLAFNQIGIGWSTVQWLVAAMSLGLGFGLQEIFANFVCGLIILLERPIRVGDIVNVGDVQGKVMRIRIRATTILDWDRRELIVPNKEFVTSKLINWTLSDPVTRVIIPVGIAYGSNMARARELLMQAAEQCPHVLDDPAPTAICKGFGDNSLEFELRVFLPNRDIWPELVDSLHTRIHDEFRDAGIEISFPQRDIHIRSVEPLARVLEQQSLRTAHLSQGQEDAA
jgi:potassium efflux system protein